MSPEIWADGKLIACVRDETGTYVTELGTPIYVNVDGIDALAKRQILILYGEEVGGRREIGLTHEGIGTSSDRKRGDGQSPMLEVKLLDRPIRVSYRDKIWVDRSLISLGGPYDRGHYEERKRTYRNPRWMRGHGRR